MSYTDELISIHQHTGIHDWKFFTISDVTYKFRYCEVCELLQAFGDTYVEDVEHDSMGRLRDEIVSSALKAGIVLFDSQNFHNRPILG